MFCYISFSKDEQFSSKFFEESFLPYKLYNYFPPSDIPSNKENNKFNLIIINSLTLLLNKILSFMEIKSNLMLIFITYLYSNTFALLLNLN